MAISSLVKQFKLWVSKQYLSVGSSDEYSGCFSGPMDIAVPPLEVAFIHYELAHELGELCKRPVLSEPSFGRRVNIEMGKDNG